MNCQDILELITADVDGELEGEDKTCVQHHLNICSNCHAELELERTTKSFVRKVVRRVAAPLQLKEEILNRLSLYPERNQQNLSFFLGLGKYFLPAAIILGGSAAAIIASVSFQPPVKHHPHTSPVDNNIIHQTYNNYDGVLDGKLLPAVTSEDRSAVKAYFMSTANFKVEVPPMPRCKLIGAIFKKNASNETAHILYKYDNKIIYLYETRLRELTAGSKIQIPEDIRAKLLTSGRYFENHVADCSFAMWIKDSTVCCAIADVSKEQLLTFLNERD